MMTNQSIALHSKIHYIKPYGKNTAQKGGQIITLRKKGKRWIVEADTLYASETICRSFDVSPEGARWASQQALNMECCSAFGFHRAQYKRYGTRKGSTFENKVLDNPWAVVGWWGFADKPTAAAFANLLAEKLPAYIPELNREIFKKGLDAETA